MPVHIETRGGKHCVVEPSGKVKKCYDDYEDALAYLRAINANTQKQQFLAMLADFARRFKGRMRMADMNEEQKSSTDSGANSGYQQTTSASGVTYETISAENVTYGPEGFEKKDREEKDAKKSMATTFEQLDAEKEAMEAMYKTNEIISDFMRLAENVMWYDEDPVGGLKNLAKEMVDRLEDKLDELPEGEEDEEDEEKGLEFKETWSKKYINDLPDSAFLYIESGGSKDSEGKTTPRSLRHLPYKDKSGKVDIPHVKNAISRASQIKLKDGKKISTAKASELKKKAQNILEQNSKKNEGIARKAGFLVWKEADGTYRWLGVYSNKFRDDDRPVQEILSEQAHKEFIDRVNKGEIGYPDLYVWHIEVPVGKADLLAYDDSGFSVVSGTFKNRYERVAKALLDTSLDLAMSHGMPAEFIERDKDDQSIITRYVSTEVSVLPRKAAANKRTSFSILAKEEKAMALDPELRDQVVGMIGEEATSDIEAELAKEAEKAKANNIDYKEQGEDTEPAEADTTEAGAEEEPVQEVVSEDAQPATEGGEPAEVVEQKSEKTNEPTKTEPSKEVDMLAELKQELTQVLAVVVKAVDENNKSLTARLDALEDKIGEFSRDEDERLAEKATGMTTARLASLLATQLAGEQATSVIGNPATHVHGNSKLAKEQPEESDKQVAEEPQGLFFQQWTN